MAEGCLWPSIPLAQTPLDQGDNRNKEFKLKEKAVKADSWSVMQINLPKQHSLPSNLLIIGGILEH